MQTCNDVFNEINDFHNNIIKACLSASHDSLPMTGDPSTSKSKNNIKAGWNDFCKEKKEIALYWHHKWVNEGRLHNSFNTIMRKKSRSQYHYSVKCIQKNEDLIKSEKIASTSFR